MFFEAHGQESPCQLIRLQPEKVLICQLRHFPPVNAPDMSQRVRMSLPYYPKGGWEPVVLTVGSAWQDGIMEPELLATLPQDARIVSARAPSPRWARWLEVRQRHGLRSWAVFALEGRAVAAACGSTDLVFFSNTRFIYLRAEPNLAGMVSGFPLRSRRPKDPWRTRIITSVPARANLPEGGNTCYARLLARVLEGWCLTRAGRGDERLPPDYLCAILKRAIPGFILIAVPARRSSGTFRGQPGGSSGSLR